MNSHERKHAQELFRTSSQICTATEAAGEGINLQFRHLMITMTCHANPLCQSPELVSLQNPVQKLDHTKGEIIASRYYEIPAEAIRGQHH